MKLAQRLDHIEPFYVMECAKAAAEIARSPACDPAQGGRRMIYLNIGEPDFAAPPAVQAAAQVCIAAGRTQYTPAAGLPALREAIARWYGTHFGLQIAPERVVVTAGASAALQLACLALFERGDRVLMPDPCYPCNRHFVAAADAEAVLLPAGPEQRFQPSLAQIEAAWDAHTRGVLLASPSNPTGTSIEPQEMRAIVEAVRARGGVSIVDEIYLGLSYEAHFGHSVLALGEDVISVNSFSKYFGMTGWRLGWLVAPTAAVPELEKLAQNLYISAPSMAQQAALACFAPTTIAILEERREEFARRRDFLLPALRELGFGIAVEPEGAFYLYADISAFGGDAYAFCKHFIETEHVAFTPGLDFGRHQAGHHVRFAYTQNLPRLQEAVERIARGLKNWRP